MQLENVEDIYKLSPMQQGMLFHTLYNQQAGGYFQQIVYTLHGALDAAAFRRAWQQVVDRHPALRTAFLWQGLDEPLQVVRQHAQLPWAEHDWRDDAPERQQQLLDAFLDEQRRRGFDLDACPLINCTLIRIAEDSFWFVWNHHHIILDAWSTAIALGEVFALYDAFRRGEPLALEAPRPYRDYIAWLQRQDTTAATAFWQRALQGFTAPTPLSAEKADARALVPFAGAGNRSIELSRPFSDELRALAQQQHLTLNTLVRGAWALLLSRYSGMDDVLFGCTTSGRPASLPAVESVVGLFINTMPARVQVPSRANLIPWLQELQVQQVQQDQYAYSPLVDVQGWSDVPRGVPLFESLLVFENAPANSAAQVQQSGLAITDIRYNGRTNYPLAVEVVPGPELFINIQYAADRFDPDAIARMLGHLQTLLQAMAADPHQQLGAIPWMTQAEHQQIVEAWNATAAAYPAAQCLHQLFEEQAAETPERVAVVFEDIAITYAQLDRYANMLAQLLRGRGVGPDTLVAVYMERSAELLVALLGILKAGGAYLPLDPAYPPERLAFMLKDSQAPLILTSQELRDWRLEIGDSSQPPTLVRLDADWPVIAQQPTTCPDQRTKPGNLAYVIYTSGSTGRPKGVQIPHTAAVNLLAAMAARPGLCEQDVLLAITTLSFDIAALELFLPLVSGARAVLAPREVTADGRRLAQLLAASGATMMQATPATWRILIASGWRGAPNFRALCGGEALPYELACQLAAQCGELWNMYGPTETTIWSATGQFCAGDSMVTIGRPIANTQIYILDRRLQPLPVGVPGGVYIGGDGLARGYLNRPDLTAERFVPNPFAGVTGDGCWVSEDSAPNTQHPTPNTRLYRTGDLARYWPDGTIECLGRNDQQVKLRGHRIELGEVAATLLQHPLIDEAVVVVREDTPGDARLLAYLVSTREQGTGNRGQEGTTSDTASLSPVTCHLSPQELRAFLKQRLPDYMIPVAFIALDALPLTPNGKIDRRALPAPSADRPNMETAFVAPRTFAEEKLAALWSELLHVDQVGVDDNFFLLGGHSLSLMRLASHIHESFEVDIPLHVLFDKPTVAHMSRAIDERLVEEVAPEEFAELLQEIDALSDDELQVILETEVD